MNFLSGNLLLDGKMWQFTILTSTMKEMLRNKSLFWAVSSTIVLLALFSSFGVSKTENVKKKGVVSYRVFSYPYPRVWNKLVQLIIVDMEYLPEVADPQEGFMSTQWKIAKGNDSKHSRRMRIHVNVKKTTNGSLVTIRCEIEEFTPVGNTGKGRWTVVPSDNTCESEILDKLEEKLKK